MSPEVVSTLVVTSNASGTVEFAVKVVPGASRSRLAGMLGTALKVAIAAPPEGGKVNAALCAFLAKQLGLRPAQIEVISGHTQPRKRVRIRGLSESELRQRLAQAPDRSS